MYSILPAFVSALFLGCGVYAVSIRAINRVSLSFFFLCLTTAFWQGIWALLFQTNDINSAHLLVKAGYLLIIFLPTSFYLFITEMCNKGSERRYVIASYGLASALAVCLLGGDQFVSGQYRYFFGFYPKAGPLHPIHVAQTLLLAGRCFAIISQKLPETIGRERARLRMSLISLCIYAFAALDYLCNYGIEFYPPGALFLVVSFISFAFAIVRYDLIKPHTIAASVAHELKTPLVAMKIDTDLLGKHLPTLIAVYIDAIEHDRIPTTISVSTLRNIEAIPGRINQSLRQSNVGIDTFLAVSRELKVTDFDVQSIQESVDGALKQYPFLTGERELVKFADAGDFEFRGSNELMIYVLFNLLKNALWSIQTSMKGEVLISTSTSHRHNLLHFTDTAAGIDDDDLPYIFEPFFSTKGKRGTGVGLTFCQNVLQAFGGDIICRSEKGKYTTFVLKFPHTSPST